ncbi:MAG: VanW family protein, partial [Paenibacillus sp.]|nr:VanW family protein [Paenibacillus sp.]
QQLTQALTAIWPDRLQPPVKNAERVVTADDMIRYVPEQRAQAIDISRLKEVLVAVGHERFRHIAASGAAPPPAPVAVPMRERLPVVTLDTLKAQGINRKIAEYSTTFPGSVAGRVHNIQATAAAIHDKLLAPGEKFDYSTVVHATEKQIGYREAPVIFNGKLVPGVGGGICQVSSTLYNAVLLAGLKVNERRNHSLPVSYVPLGQDATYADGYINFTFTNSSGSYLLIRTVVDASKITVKLFGSLPDTITYAVESQVLQTIEPPVKYVRNPLLPEGKQVVLQQGKPGYVVDTYRSRMDNGAVVSKERLSHDTYEPQPTLIAIRGSEASADNKVAPQSGALASELIPNTLRGPQNGSRSGVRSIVEDGISGPVFRTGR